MSATNVFENGLLSLIFENANYANVGDATGLRGSSTAGVFYVSLHTANPNETGSQTTSEAAYTSGYWWKRNRNALRHWLGHFRRWKPVSMGRSDGWACGE
jgi:hypothetical protein